MYLVDGNNVMGQRVGWHRDKPAAQKRLLLELVRLSRHENRMVTVVFDGPPLPGMEDRHDNDGVRVYFARRGSDADERIIELVQDAQADQPLVAVTSDKLLSQRLQSYGVATLRSGEFRKMLDAL